VLSPVDKSRSNVSQVRPFTGPAGRSLTALRSSVRWYSPCGSLRRAGVTTAQLNAKAANVLCLQHSMVQVCWSSSARGLSRQCAPSPPPVHNVSPRYHFATRTAAALHAGCRRVYHGAHRIPYYHNALADPHWQQKTDRCAESWTEGGSGVTASLSRGTRTRGCIANSQPPETRAPPAICPNPYCRSAFFCCCGLGV
jgi:hypothetical protein